MAETWPETLPQYLLVANYSQGIADGRLVSQTDTGPAKVRRRSSAMPRPLSGSMAMSAAQVSALRTFVETTLIGGSLPFNFSDQFGGDGSLLCRFVSMPAWTAVHNDLFMVSLDLEVLP